MYAFVVMILLNGVPQLIIMERGLTEAACLEMAAQPDTGLRIDGQQASGEGRCVPEDSLPSEDDPQTGGPV